MNINAASADLHLKSLSSTQIARRDSYVPAAGIRTPAGSCHLFPVGRPPPEVETWDLAQPLLARPPMAAFPEPLKTHSRGL